MQYVRLDTSNHKSGDLAGSGVVTDSNTYQHVFDSNYQMGILMSLLHF